MWQSLNFLTSHAIRILILENVETEPELYLRKLRDAGLQLHADIARSARDFQSYGRSQAYDLILADFELPDWTGLDAFDWFRSLGHDTPFVLVTKTSPDELATRFFNAGLND